VNTTNNNDEPSASNDGALLCGTDTGVMLVLELLVLTTLTPSLLVRSHDDTTGRLATGCSVAEGTDDAGLFADSDDTRRSADTGFSGTNDEVGGFVSTGETSVLTES